MASNSQEAPILWFLLIQIKPYRGIDAALNGCFGSSSLLIWDLLSVLCGQSAATSTTASTCLKLIFSARGYVRRIGVGNRIKGGQVWF
jgi:hypothetical protein